MFYITKSKKLQMYEPKRTSLQNWSDSNDGDLSLLRLRSSVNVVHAARRGKPAYIHTNNVLLEQSPSQQVVELKGVLRSPRLQRWAFMPSKRAREDKQLGRPRERYRESPGGSRK